jgi:hypothetical protein
VFVGALRFRGEKLVLDRKVANFVEVYGRRRPVVDIPKVTVAFGPPVVNGKAPKNAAAKATYPKGVPDYADTVAKDASLVITVGTLVDGREKRRVNPIEAKKQRLERSDVGRRSLVPRNHDHRHGHRAGSRRRLALTLMFAAGYMLADVVGGLLTNSLALLADAGHMLSDVAALGLSLFAVWIAERPLTARRTYGYYRAKILAALANGAALIAMSLYVFVEAYHRLRQPPEIQGAWMLAVAVGGVAVEAEDHVEGRAAVNGLLKDNGGEAVQQTVLLRR